MPFDLDLYQRQRSSRIVGAQVRYRPETTSTMDDAREGARGGMPEGTAYVAGVQTGGRGRLGRSWASADSGLWVTYHLVAADAESAPLLSLAGALAVDDAVRRTTLLASRIKWPNDVLHEGRKLAGVLAESAVGERTDVFLGIGINVRRTDLPPEIAARATSIEEAGATPPALEALLAALSAALEHHTTRLQETPDAVVWEWRHRLSTLGQRVRLFAVDGSVCEGEAVDVSGRGELMLRLDDGRIASFAAGEVTTAPDGLDRASAPA